MFGVLYVLEGSRLGARILVKQIRAGCPALSEATAFLTHGQGSRLWPTFLQALESGVDREGLDAAINGAGYAFSLFDMSFARALPGTP